MAHKYGSIDKMVVWEAVKEDIPSLRNNCIKILNNINEWVDKLNLLIYILVAI